MAKNERVSGEYAGYMELNGAKKDGDCNVVEVKGGVSKYKGCCNLFDPFPNAQRFDCGHCEHVEDEPR